MSNNLPIPITRDGVPGHELRGRFYPVIAGGEDAPAEAMPQVGTQTIALPPGHVLAVVPTAQPISNPRQQASEALPSPLGRGAGGEGPDLQGEVTQLMRAYRDGVRAANPDAVPELITGDTVDEINASVERARTAFSNAVERARTLVGPQGQPGSPTVGNPARVAAAVPDSVRNASPEAKIAYGLRLHNE